jgi:NADH:ubiquinone oxidoreductase subunit
LHLSLSLEAQSGSRHKSATQGNANVLGKIFTWWNGATLGAMFDIGKRADLVGQDDQGNRYFEERKATLEGRKRRYVMYNGYAEPSRVPVDWHGWLHHTFEVPPTIEPFLLQSWEKQHQPNLTGTIFAYRPKGSLASLTSSDKKAIGYEAWEPK